MFKRYKMRIALVSELYGTQKQGGENIAAFYLSKYLKKKKMHVELFSFKDNINSKLPNFLKSAPYIRQLVIPFIDRRLFLKLEKKYDLIHSTTTTCLAFFKPRVPVILTCHGTLCKKFRTMAKDKRYRLLFNKLFFVFFKYLEKRSLRNIDKIIALREEMKDYLIYEFNIPENKIVIIPNGVDVELFKPSNKKNNQVLFVGRATFAKGIDTLIKVSDYIDSNIIIVTTKISEKTLALVEKKKNIEILMNLSHEDLAKIYSQSKIFVLPSITEEQPLTVLEAMATSLPIITTKEGASNLILDGKNGIIINERDYKTLALSINKLINNKEESDKIGKLNRSIVEKKYSWDIIADETIKVYSGVIKNAN